MAKLTLTDITSQYGSQAVFNANNTLVEEVINDKVLFRDNPSGEPNQMENNLDMNSNKILNLPQATSGAEPVTLNQLLAYASGEITAGTVVETFTATSGQTVFNITTTTYTLGANNLSVYVNGVRQYSGDYTETSNSQFTFGSGLQEGDLVVAVINERNVSVDIVSSSSVTITVNGRTTNVSEYLNSRVATDFINLKTKIAANTYALGDHVQVEGYPNPWKIKSGIPPYDNGSWVDGGNGQYAETTERFTSIEVMGGAADWNGSTGTNNVEALTEAINTRGNVEFKAGSYWFSGTVIANNIGNIHIRGAGQGQTFLYVALDQDFLQLFNTVAGGYIHIEHCTIVPLVNMNVGSAINIQSTALPAFKLNDLFIGSPATNAFWRCVRATNFTEATIEDVTCYGLGVTNSAAFDFTNTASSTAPKFNKVRVYNYHFAAAFLNTTNGGIEGLQFNQCDFVGVVDGVRYRNSFGTGYFPPQITWQGGHINASNRNFDLEICSQVKIANALLYNSGSAEFIRLNTVAEYSINDNIFVDIGGSSNGIDIVTSAAPIEGGTISGNRFKLNGSASAVRLDYSGGPMTNIDIVKNRLISGSSIVNIASGSPDDTLNIDNYDKDTDDVYQSVAITSSVSTFDITGKRADFILLSSTVANNITTMTGRRIGARITLKCDSNITLVHNGIVDGFILAGGVNFTFSTGSVITLERRNGGYWQQVGAAI